MKLPYLAVNVNVEVEIFMLISCGFCSVYVKNVKNVFLITENRHAQTQNAYKRHCCVSHHRNMYTISMVYLYESTNCRYLKWNTHVWINTEIYYIDDVMEFIRAAI